MRIAGSVWSAVRHLVVAESADAYARLTLDELRGEQLLATTRSTRAGRQAGTAGDRDHRRRDPQPGQESEAPGPARVAGLVELTRPSTDRTRGSLAIYSGLIDADVNSRLGLRKTSFNASECSFIPSTPPKVGPVWYHERQSDALAHQPREFVEARYAPPRSPPLPPSAARLIPSAIASGSAAATILNTPTFGPTAVNTAVTSSTDAPASRAALTCRT